MASRIRNFAPPGSMLDKSKRCGQCGESFARRKSHTMETWQASRYCSPRCAGLAKRKHGESGGGRAGHTRRSPEYVVWVGIIGRCENPANKDYPRYGGRGIKVCQNWRDSYEMFLADVGRRPSLKHSIDRHPNNDGNYEPSNVRWATPEQQQRNRCNTRMIGDRPLVEVAEAAGMKAKTLRERLGRGIPADVAIDSTDWKRHPRESAHRHLKAVKSLPCTTCGSDPPSEAAHVRMGSRAHGKRPTGMGEKPSDKWVVPLCGYCHRNGRKAQHRMGERQFWLMHGIDPFPLCEALYAASPNIEQMIVIVNMRISS